MNNMSTCPQVFFRASGSAFAAPHLLAFIIAAGGLAYCVAADDDDSPVATPATTDGPAEAAAQPEQSIRKGLFAEYRLDGDTKDTGGANRDAKTDDPNQAFTKDRHGKRGRAIELKGNGGLDVGEGFRFGSFSVAMWVKPAGHQVPYANIIDNNHGDGINWVAQQTDQNLNQYHFGVGKRTERGAKPKGAVVHFGLTSDKWQHLVLVKNSQHVIAYVDGEVVDKAATSPAINYARPPHIRIGGLAGGGRFWKGSIDDVTLHQRALTQEEIRFLSKPPEPVVLVDGDVPEGCSPEVGTEAEMANLEALKGVPLQSIDGTEQQVLFDLRQRDHATAFETSAVNASVQQFGDVFYWAPQKIGEWASVTYSIKAPFAIADVEFSQIDIFAWNEHADVCWDEDAEAHLDVSIDGQKWVPIVCLTPEEGLWKNEKWFEGVKGAKHFFLRARLFGKKQSRPDVHHVQFLRSIPSNGGIPWISIWSTVVPEADRKKRVETAGLRVQQRHALQLAAKQAEAEKLRAEAEKRKYTLADGGAVTGKEIQDWNNTKQGETARFILTCTNEQQIDFELALKVFLKIKDYTEAGDNAQLATYMRMISQDADVLRAIEQLLMRSPLSRAVVPCADGKAREWQRVWADALGTLAR